jgi:flavin-dependent dehydrogenase
MEHVDLVVVGAGPAGAAAAIRFLQLRPSAHVVVIDKAVFPRDKPCGDGLGPDAVGELVTLGAAAVLEGRVPVTKVRLCSPSGRSVVGTPRGRGSSFRGWSWMQVLPRWLKSWGPMFDMKGWSRSPWAGSTSLSMMYTDRRW